MFSSLQGFINGGGRVLIQAYSLASSPTLAAAFQVAIESRSTVPLPVWDWSGSPLFTGMFLPVNLMEFSVLEDLQKLHPLNGGLAVAGFTTVPASGEGAIVIGNGGRTIVNGFYAEGAFFYDIATQLGQNEIGFLIGAIGAPAISSQPQDRFVQIGATAAFGVIATGGRPFTFQWRKDGQPILEATGTNYTITGVQSNHFGSYDVVVTNSSGSVTSRVAVLDLGEELVIASVGDSLLYVLDSESFRAVTEDQSWVNEVGRPLGLDEAALRSHPLRNVLTMAIGAGAQIVVNRYSVPWKPGSLALLSSDGLHGVVGRDDLEQILRAPEPLDVKCHRFIEAARSAGAPDNVTAVLLRRWD